MPDSASSCIWNTSSPNYRDILGPGEGTAILNIQRRVYIMEHNKLVSVILTTHNRPPEIVLRTVNSVLNQTYKNIQLILIDDGSTDNSQSVCESYADKDSRVLWFIKVTEDQLLQEIRDWTHLKENTLCLLIRMIIYIKNVLRLCIMR